MMPLAMPCDYRRRHSRFRSGVGESPGRGGLVVVGWAAGMAAMAVRATRFYDS